MSISRLRIGGLVARVRRRVARYRFEPRVSVRAHPNLQRLGTPYGGWTFAAVPELRDCVVISCGLGEDASFDVEFASEFGAQILVVDPTPRAVRHFHDIESRLGLGRERPYSEGGKQPVEAYELSKVVPGQLVLVEKAVSDTVGRVRFYAPKNPDHVSHSIVNFQNDYSLETPYIEVDSVDFATLIAMVDSSRLQLVKFDIEGAEIGVIQQMLKQNIHPRQICIEFDELAIRSKRARANFEKCRQLLSRAQYVPAYFDGTSNFLFLDSSLY